MTTITDGARLALRSVAGYLTATGRHSGPMLEAAADGADYPLDHLAACDLERRGRELCIAGHLLGTTPARDLGIEQGDVDAAVLTICAQIQRVLDAERVLGIVRQAGAQ